jgi:hypothetical protein
LDSVAVNLATIASLCNAIHANAWICVPHKASDALVNRFATYLRDHLASDLKVYVEYSNECWNWIFSQTAYCHDQGVALGLDSDEWVAWMKFYAKRSAEIHALFDAAFGAGSSRVVRLVAWQSFNAYQCNQVLGYYKTYRGREADALAVAPYFGGGLGTSDTGALYADEVVGWSLDKLFTHLDPTNSSQLSGGKDEGNLKQIKAVIESDAAIAKSHGVPLIAYEAGQHLVGVGSWMNNTTLTNLFIGANRDPRMGAMYTKYLDIWRAAGGRELMLYASSGSHSKYGSWAIKENQTDNRSAAPKYDASLTWIGANPQWF